MQHSSVLQWGRESWGGGVWGAARWGLCRDINGCTTACICGAWELCPHPICAHSVGLGSCHVPILVPCGGGGGRLGLSV